ncbi:Tetratricopeptide repeat-containing domain, partial [Globisporangium splendens]
MGDYLKAFGCMERALVLRRHLFGADSPEVLHACKALAEMCNLLSMSFLQQDNCAVAIDLLKKAEILTKHHPSGKATTLNNLACYYRRLGKLHAAMTCLKRALEIEKKLQNVRNAADTHLNICAVLSQLGKHQNALEQAQEALIILQEEFFQSKQTSPGHQEGKNVGPADAKKKNENGETSSSSQQLDRVSVMCIAYHNIGVEQEFLKDYEDSVMSYKKASLSTVVGVGLAEQYLGVDHAITTTVRNSYLAAKRTMSTKSAGKRKQISAGFDSPGKSSTRLLSSPRSGSLTNSLRLPSPLAKERQRHTSSGIPAPRSIVADVLSKGSILPPSVMMMMRGELIQKEEKEVKFGSPREKTPLGSPNNSASTAASKSPASEMPAENKLQPNGIDDQHKQLSSISVPFSEETRIKVAESEPNEILQTCDIIHDAEADSGEKLSAALEADQSGNDATASSSSNASYDSETEDREHRDVSTFLKDSSNNTADSSNSPDESSPGDMLRMVVDDKHTDLTESEQNLSESAVCDIGSNTLVSEDTTAQESAESGNEATVNFGFTEPDPAQRELDGDVPHICEEDSHTVSKEILDNNYSSGVVQHSDEACGAGDNPATFAAILEDLIVGGDQPSHPIDGMDATYEEDIVDIPEESSQAPAVLDHNNENVDIDISLENAVEDTTQTGSDSDTSAIAVSEDPPEQTSEVEPVGIAEEETLEENDMNNSTSSCPDLEQAASGKEEDNGVSTADDSTPEPSSELPMDFATIEQDDTVSEDQAVSMVDSLSDQPTAADSLLPDNMDNGSAVPENHSQEWISESSEHVESSFGVEGDYTHAYENHEEYTGDGEGYHESYGMDYQLDNAAVEFDGYHDATRAEESHAEQLTADYASTPDQAVYDTNTVDHPHGMLASDLTYDDQFEADAVEFNYTVYHDQFEEYHDQPGESSSQPATDGYVGSHFDPESEMPTTHVPSEDSYDDVNYENPSHETGIVDEVPSESTTHEAVSSCHVHDSNAVPDENDSLEGEGEPGEPVAIDAAMAIETENLSQTLSNCNASDEPAERKNSPRSISHKREQ